MMSSPRHRVGKPRFDKTNRLLHRFYEPIILLSILDPARGSEEWDFAGERRGIGFRGAWRNFLDGLSWICDYKKGGETVSSVVAELTYSGSKFWLTAPDVKAKPHLQSVLEKLVRIPECSPSEVDETQSLILRQCIDFSKNRVHNYSRFLCARIEDVSNIGSGEQDKALLEELNSLREVRYEFHELCSRAYNFRNIVHLTDLAQNDPSEPSIWAQIRHQIGRLGSWSRAVKHFVSVAKLYPQHLYGFSLEYLAFPKPVKLPPPDEKVNLESALGRMVPQRSNERVADLLASLTAIRVFSFEQKFKDKYNAENFRPRVHAEVLMWEHFYFNNLWFVGNDKYVGCSKASCWCCHLYMQFHPGHPAARRCHGNLWAQWSPPLPVSTTNESQDNHVRDILTSMSQRIRADLIEQIESRNPLRPRQPESSTGITWN